MLRKLGPSLLYTCTNLKQCRIMCVGGFKSAYSLDKLYPNNTITTEESSKLNSIHLLHPNAQKQTVAGTEEQFNGHIPVDKLTIKYSNSSGPGGQHVNKVNTKADVRFHVATADWLPQHIRDKILEKKQTKINKAGELIFQSERTRSQINNFADCLQKIRDTVVEVTRKPKEPTEKDRTVFALRIEKANRERLKQKKSRSSIKRDRKVFVD